MDSDLLSSLLSDPQKMSQLLETASSFLNASPSSDHSEEKNVSEKAESQNENPIRQESFTKKENLDNSVNPSGDLMKKVMPLIAAVNRSGQNAVNKDKWNLLLALKPFVATDVSKQMDRAVHLISLARMTKTAIRELGNRGSSSL